VDVSNASRSTALMCSLKISGSGVSASSTRCSDSESTVGYSCEIVSNSFTNSYRRVKNHTKMQQEAKLFQTRNHALGLGPFFPRICGCTVGYVKHIGVDERI